MFKAFASYLCGINDHPWDEVLGPGKSQPKARTPAGSTAKQEDAGMCRVGVQAGRALGGHGVQHRHSTLE